MTGYLQFSDDGVDFLSWVAGCDVLSSMAGWTFRHLGPGASPCGRSARTVWVPVLRAA
jgi:hypothetical protein